MVDRRCARGEASAAVEAAVRGGVDWVQVRERELEGRALLEFADAVAAAARRGARERGTTARVLVNRRADVALAIEADDRYPYVSSMWNEFIGVVMKGSGPSAEKARQAFSLPG